MMGDLFHSPKLSRRGHDLRDLPIVAFDIETTGLPPGGHRIVEHLAKLRRGRPKS